MPPIPVLHSSPLPAAPPVPRLGSGGLPWARAARRCRDCSSPVRPLHLIGGLGQQAWGLRRRLESARRAAARSEFTAEPVGSPGAAPPDPPRGAQSIGRVDGPAPAGLLEGVRRVPPAASWGRLHSAIRVRPRQGVALNPRRRTLSKYFMCSQTHRPRRPAEAARQPAVPRRLPAARPGAAEGGVDIAARGAGGSPRCPGGLRQA